MTTTEPSSSLLRSLVIAGGFLTITVALLLLQPGPEAPRDRAEPALPMPAAAETETVDAAPQPVSRPELQVSRAETGIDLVSTLPPSGSLAATVVPPSVAMPAAPVAEPALPAAAATLPAAPMAVAATIAPAAADMRRLTSDALVGLSLAGAPLSGPRPQVLNALVAQSLTRTRPDAYLDRLQGEASRTRPVAGGLAGAPSLQSTLAAQPATPLLPAVARDATGDPGVEVVTIQRAGGTERQTLYNVQPGDNLGSIAQKFYGDSRHYITIFNANRQLLSTPDGIRQGQRLIIPARSST